MARPRGFATWSPSDEAAATIADVKDVLDTYRRYLPMTSRQIFYRLVASVGYPKTEKAYKTLCERLVRARRAGLISFSSIRDDEITAHGAGGGYADPSAYWEDLPGFADYYGRPTRDDQDWSIECWVESGGMSSMVARMVHAYGVPVYSSGGFLSVTATHDVAVRALRDDRKRVILSVGDYDPSGVAIYNALEEDATHFYAHERAKEDGARGYDITDYEDEFVFERIALTEDQVYDLGVETAPPKSTDSRSNNWSGETAQAEALDPETLRGILDDAVKRYTDMDVMAAVEARSADEREEIADELREYVDGRES